MTTIGVFSKTDDGGFRGRIRTLTLDLKAVDIRPVAPAGDKAPDFRVAAGPLDLGAAWTLSRPGKPDALSVRLDDPALPAPLHALLVEAGDAHELRWSRRSRA